MSDEISMNSREIKDLQRQFDRMNKRSREGMQEIAVEYAHKLREAVQHNASGRPGPEIETGSYVNSVIVTEVERNDNMVDLSVSTDHPEAPRLEFGFVGVDSMGRHYDQPPFPHWQPAVDEVSPEYFKAIEEAIPKWWKG